MKQLVVKIGNIKISNSLPFVLFGGMNVLESLNTSMKICEYYINITKKLNIPYIFKASFDKANRSSIKSYRGPGLKKGIKIFEKLKSEFNVKIMTDVHNEEQAKIISNFVDVIQIPAFLARQTDLIKSVSKTGSVINIKKPQFMNPTQIINIVEKCRAFGNNKIILCERGSSFGYDNLIVDILGLHTMSELSGGCPILLDVTHSLQTRDPFGKVSYGRRDKICDLARAGIAVIISGIFIESHFNPNEAKCDGPSALPIKKLESFLSQIKSIDQLVKSFIKIDIK
ncbi:3-deoxy-8-phosphooctulonate synthase [Sodalis-like secondary symbiont of Drepanosiphum platanoidis]|uniref:3-deoxy-8-phosphooctulonate synthase n=1 Tax=Sodalis-like secondary symbiont of Drepanosiphum platanoidis TaxID=2994493 RepID=UPI003463B8AE